MLGVDVATNLLATALWEFALRPLYRSPPIAKLLPNSERRALDEALGDAARRLALSEQAESVTPETWDDFFRSDEIRTLAEDLLAFRMDEAGPDLTDLRATFVVRWQSVARREGIPDGLVDIGRVFTAVVDSIDAVLRHAIRRQVLSAHEARAVARHRVVEARLDVIEGLLSAAPEPETIAAYERFAGDVSRAVRARYGKIHPPSVLGAPRVDLDSLFVSPTLSVHEPEPREALTFDDFVTTIHRRVVLGNPGAGKSTLAAKVCFDLASAKRSDPRHRLTPWIVELRRFAGAAGEQSFVEFFERWGRASYGLETPPGAFEWLLAHGRMLVVFDGLDELLDTSLRADVRNLIESFCLRFATTPVLLTSRIVGYDEAPLDQQLFDAVRLEDFDEPRVHEYAGKWFRVKLDDETEATCREHTSNFMRDSEVAGELRNSPLLLGLLASLYRGPGSIPNNLPDVYDSCATLLFSTWDKQRHIEVILPFAEHVRPALRELAWWLFNDQRLAVGVTRRQAIEKTTDYLSRRRFGDPDRARAAAEDFIKFCRGRAWVFSDQGSTAVGEDLFGFTHRTFLEFFAAEHLAYRRQPASELVEELIPHIVDASWDVVALIALQIKARSYPEGADEVVVALVNALRDHTAGALVNGVDFLLRLLQAVVPSPVATRHLGLRLTLFTSRELDASNQFGLRLAISMATIGPEVRDEFIEGVVAGECLLIRETSAPRRQVGATLAFHPGELLMRSDPQRDEDDPEPPGAIGVARAVAFWNETGQKLTEAHGDEIMRAAAIDELVALDVWPRLMTLEQVIQCHGFHPAFARPESRRYTARKPPARLLLAAVTGSGGDAEWAWAELDVLGEALAAVEPPWLRAHPGSLTRIADELGALAASLHGRIETCSDTQRFAIWVSVALAYEDLQRYSRYSLDEELTELLAFLAYSHDAFFRSLSSTVRLRLGLVSPEQAELAGLGLPPERLRLVDAWTGRRRNLIQAGVPMIRQGDGRA